MKHSKLINSPEKNKNTPYIIRHSSFGFDFFPLLRWELELLKFEPVFLRFGEDPPWRSRFGGVALCAAGGQWLRRAGGRRAGGCGSTGAGCRAVELLIC